MTYSPIDLPELVVEFDDDPERRCTYMFCDDGNWWGSDFGDPLWYDPTALYPCPSCGGSGLAKDMTLW